MFKEAKEITIDDVIEFIIKNCDNTDLMDKINKTSFPFTTKYLNSNKWKATAPSINTAPSTTITTTPYYPYGNTILCSSDEALSHNEE